MTDGPLVTDPETGSARLPPGPKGLPVLGSLVAFARDPLGFLTASARAYGDIVLFTVVGKRNLLLSDPEAIEQVLVKRHGDFPKDRQFWRHVTAVFGQGLLTSAGALWQRQRRLAAPAFATRPLAHYADDMARITAATLDRWRPGETHDLHAEMMTLTLRIAARTLFGTEVEEDIATIEAAVEDLIVEVAARIKRPILIPDWVPLPGHLRYRRGMRRIESIVARLLAERRARPDGATDLLSQLFTARDEAGAAMSDRQLRDEVVTFLLAGHETTALALSWSLHLLSRHPDIQERLAHEAAHVLEDRAGGMVDLEGLRFCEAVVTESMRLYPPAWAIGREAGVDTMLAGYRIGAGTPLYILPWILHRDPRFYDEPEAFRPERWQGDLADRLPRFAYMPFGGGPRVCIGNRFAMMEAVLILALLVRRFRFHAVEDRPAPVPFPSITLRPQGGVWARIEARV